MPELRKDPVTGRWIIISGERADRPITVSPKPEETPNSRPCPFDPGHEPQTPPEIMAFRPPDSAPNSSGWTLRVVPNKYPALIIENQLKRQGEGIYDRMTGVGAHEVIIETPDHRLNLADLDDISFRDVIRAYVLRVIDLARDDRFKYVLVFKNHGASAGASLPHSHSQLIATPVVPELVKEELSRSRQYWDFHERCIFCDLLRQEQEAGKRVVLENDHFLSFQPFAPRFPFESWIVSKRHFGTFAELQEPEIAGLAQVLKATLQRINRALANPDYNYIVHTSPLHDPGLEYYHFHVEIIPKQTTVAGFEWGTGFFINPVSPEAAARRLKEVEVRS